MFGKEGIERKGGRPRAFALKELVESRLCRIAKGSDERRLRFEYDTNIPRLLIGREKELGELITIVFGYSWDRLDRSGLDVAVQGFNENDDLIKAFLTALSNIQFGQFSNVLTQVFLGRKTDMTKGSVSR